MLYYESPHEQQILFFFFFLKKHAFHICLFASVAAESKTDATAELTGTFEFFAAEFVFIHVYKCQ